jgi:N-acetylglucosaminyl-diphospho-decaprenol L-rhamnosyltransferase
VLVAVVVTYSAAPGELERCVDALSGAGGVDRIVVCDTGGAARLGDVSNSVPVEVLHLTNRGYGAAANAGFARAERLAADRVALLNDDVIVRPGWLGPLVQALESGDRVGAAQPVLLVAGTDIVNSMGVAIDRHGAGVDVNDGERHVPAGPDATAEPIELFTGGAVLFRTDFLAQLGGFDERWFLYYEDVDLARRGAARGWEYRLAHGSVVEHARGASTSGDPGRTRFLQERNRLWHAFRYAAPPAIGRALWLSVRRLRHRPRAVHAKALLAGLAGAPRMLGERRAGR